MALILVKNGTSDEFSLGDELDPVVNAVTLDDDSSPATVDSDSVNFEIKASTYNYTGIALSVTSEEAGIDYKLSLNNTDWHDSLTGGASDDLVNGVIGDMDATGGDVTKDVYIKAVVDNDGSVSSGNHATPNLQLTATENQ